VPRDASTSPPLIGDGDRRLREAHFWAETNDAGITTDLKQVLKRLKLGPILDTLPERLAPARQQKMPHQDFLLLILSDEVTLLAVADQRLTR